VFGQALARQLSHDGQQSEDETTAGAGSAWFLNDCYGLLPVHPSRTARSSRRRRAGSAITSTSEIFPALIFRPSTRNRRPRGATTTPTAPFTSAARAACARPEKSLATACAPRTSADGPPRSAAGSGRKTTSGSSTETSASKSPPRAAARKAPTTSRWRAMSGAAAAPRTRRRARLASCRAAAGAAEPQPGLLHRVLGFAERPEHAVGHPAQAAALGLEALRQPFVLVHRSHSPALIRHGDDEWIAFNVTQSRPKPDRRSTMQA